MTRPEPLAWTAALALLALLMLSWPLLELPLLACAQARAAPSAALLRACASDPLVYLFAVWGALVAGLILRARSGRSDADAQG